MNGHQHIEIGFSSEVMALLEKSLNIHQQLNQIERKVNKIMATTADLEQAISDLTSSVTSGFQAIDTAVSAAADRVIASINAGGDPAAQIAEITALKDSVSAQTQAEVDKVNAIDPTNPPPTA